MKKASLRKLFFCFLSIFLTSITVIFFISLKNKNKSNTQVVATCSNFEEISNFLSQEIKSANLDEADKRYFYKDDFIFWRRKENESLVGYLASKSMNLYIPIYNSTQRNLEYVDNKNILIEKLKTYSNSTDLIEDTLNTYILDEKTSTDHFFGFKKNNDLYSIEFAIGNGDIDQGLYLSIKCAEEVGVNEYNKYYDLLNKKAHYPILDQYDDYILITAISHDGSVFTVVGSDNNIPDISYQYYYDGESLKIVGKDQHPADCSSLENQKIGFGLDCVDNDNIFRTVRY